ncbi:MAG: hypothetical protein KAJ44_02330, partial [Thermoplasmatales archaeon]|nr:hypothetical protein [Thermoplasmatales archaeon]
QTFFHHIFSSLYNSNAYIIYNFSLPVFIATSVTKSKLLLEMLPFGTDSSGLKTNSNVPTLLNQRHMLQNPMSGTV